MSAVVAGRRRIWLITFGIVAVLSFAVYVLGNSSKHDFIESNRSAVRKSPSKHDTSSSIKRNAEHGRPRTRFPRSALPRNDVRAHHDVMVDVHAPGNVLKGGDLVERPAVINDHHGGYMVHTLSANGAADEEKRTNIVIICATVAICLHFLWCLFISCWESYRWKKRVVYHLPSDLGRGFYPYIVFLKSETSVNKGNRCRDTFMHFVIEGIEGSSDTFSFNIDSGIDVNEFSGTMFLLQTEGCLGNLIAFHMQITGLEHCCIKCKVAYVEVIDPVTNEKWYFPLRDTVQSGCGPVRMSRNTRQEKEYWLWKDSFNRAWDEYNIWSALGYSRRYGSGLRRALHLTLPLLFALYIMLANTFTISMSTTITWRLLAAFVINASIAAVVALAQWVLANTRVSTKSLKSRLPLMHYLGGDISARDLSQQQRLQQQQQQQQHQVQLQQRGTPFERSMADWSTTGLQSFGQSQSSYGAIGGYPSLLRPPVGVFRHHRGSYQLQDLPYPFGGEEREEWEESEREGSVARDEGDAPAETGNQCMLPDGTIMNMCQLQSCPGAPCASVCHHGCAVPAVATCCHTVDEATPCQQNAINTHLACATQSCVLQNATCSCFTGLSKTIDSCGKQETCVPGDHVCTTQTIFPTSVTFNHCPSGRKEGQSQYQVQKPYCSPNSQIEQMATKLGESATSPSKRVPGGYAAARSQKTGIFNYDTWRKANTNYGINGKTHNNVNMNHITTHCDQDLNFDSLIKHALISSTGTSRQTISNDTSCNHGNDRHLRKLKQIRRYLDSYCKHNGKSKYKVCHRQRRERGSNYKIARCKSKQSTSEFPMKISPEGESSEQNHTEHKVLNQQEACERLARSVTERIFNTISDNILNRNVNASNAYANGFASRELDDVSGSSDTDDAATNDAVIFELDHGQRLEKVPSDENLTNLREDFVETIKDLSGTTGIRSSVQEILNMARSHRFSCETDAFSEHIAPTVNQTALDDVNKCRKAGYGGSSTDESVQSQVACSSCSDDTSEHDSKKERNGNLQASQMDSDISCSKPICSSMSSFSCSTAMTSGPIIDKNRRVYGVAQANLSSLLRPDALHIIRQAACEYGEIEVANFAAEMTHALYDVVYAKMKRMLFEVTDDRDGCGECDPEVLMSADEQAHMLVIPVVVRHVTYMLEMETSAFQRMQIVMSMVASGRGDGVDMIVTNAYMHTCADRHGTIRRTRALASIRSLPVLAHNLTNNNNTDTLPDGEVESYLRLLFTNVLLLRQKTRDNQSLVDDVTHHALKRSIGCRLSLWLLREAQAQLDRAFAEVRMRTRRCSPSLMRHFGESVLATVSDLPSSRFAKRHRRTLETVSADMRAYAMRNACSKVARHVTRLLTSRDVGVHLERWYRIAKMMENADDAETEEIAVESVLQTDLIEPSRFETEVPTGSRTLCKKVFGLFDMPTRAEAVEDCTEPSQGTRDEFAKQQLTTMIAEFEELKQLIRSRIAKTKYGTFKENMSLIFDEHTSKETTAKVPRPNRAARIKVMTGDDSRNNRPRDRDKTTLGISASDRCLHTLTQGTKHEPKEDVYTTSPLELLSDVAQTVEAEERNNTNSDELHPKQDPKPHAITSPLRKVSEQLNLLPPHESAGGTLTPKHQHDNPPRTSSDDTLRHLASQRDIPVSSISETGTSATCMAHGCAFSQLSSRTLVHAPATSERQAVLTLARVSCKDHVNESGHGQPDEAAQQKEQDVSNDRQFEQRHDFPVRNVDFIGIAENEPPAKYSNVTIVSKIPRPDAKRTIQSAGQPQFADSHNYQMTDVAVCTSIADTKSQPECVMLPTEEVASSTTRLELLKSEAAALLQVIDKLSVKSAQSPRTQPTNCPQTENTAQGNTGIIKQRTPKPCTQMHPAMDMLNAHDSTPNRLIGVGQHVVSPKDKNFINFNNTADHAISQISPLDLRHKTTDVSTKASANNSVLKQSHIETYGAAMKCNIDTSGNIGNVSTASKENSAAIFQSTGTAAGILTKYGRKIDEQKCQMAKEPNTPCVAEMRDDSFEDTFEYNLECMRQILQNELGISSQKEADCLKNTTHGLSTEIREGLVMEMIEKLSSRARDCFDGFAAPEGIDRCRDKSIRERYAELVKPATSDDQYSDANCDWCQPQPAVRVSSRSIVEYFESMNTHHRQSLDTNAARTRHASLPCGAKSASEYGEIHVQARVRRNTASSIPVKTPEPYETRSPVTGKSCDSRNMSPERDMWSSNVGSEHMRSHLPVAMSPPVDTAIGSEESRKRRHSAYDKEPAERKPVQNRTRGTEPCTTKSHVQPNKNISIARRTLGDTTNAAKSCSGRLGLNSLHSNQQSVTVYHYKNNEKRLGEREANTKYAKPSGVQKKSANSKPSFDTSTEITHVKPSIEKKPPAESSNIRVKQIDGRAETRTPNSKHANKSANNSYGMEADDNNGDDDTMGNLAKSESRTTGYGTDNESCVTYMQRPVRSRVILNSKYKSEDTDTCNLEYINEYPSNNNSHEPDNHPSVSPTNIPEYDFAEDLLLTSVDDFIKVTRQSLSSRDENRNYNNYTLDVIGRVPTPEEAEENQSWMVYVDEYLNGKNTRQFPSASISFTAIIIVCTCVLGYSLCVIYGGQLDFDFRFTWFGSVVFAFVQDALVFEMAKALLIKWYWLSSEQMPPIV